MGKPTIAGDKKRFLASMIYGAFIVASSGLLLAWNDAGKRGPDMEPNKAKPGLVDTEASTPGQFGEREAVPPMESEDECDGSGECEWGDNGGEREAVPPMPPAYRCRPGECERDRHGNGGGLKVDDPRID